MDNLRDGDANTWFSVAVKYHQGLGVPRDLKQAARWYRMAAEQGLTEAQAQLASMYFRGEGMAQLYERAVYWYQRAAEQGDDGSCRQLAFMLADGVGSEPDFVHALYWFERYTDDKNALADFLDYLRGAANERDSGDLYFQLAQLLEAPELHASSEEVMLWYRKAADTGNDRAMLIFAKRLRSADADAEVIKRSREYLIKAKDAGVEEARWELACHRYEEEPSDSTLAEVNEAAKAGHSACQLLVARLRLDESQSEPSFEVVLTYLKAAAENESLEAQHLLGRALLKCEPARVQESIAWFNRAARNGCVSSMWELARNSGLTADENQMWLRNAAANDHADAQFELGLYHLGQNDVESATGMLNRAVSNGHLGAHLVLADILAEQEDADWAKISSLLFPAAEAGHGLSSLRLSEIYKAGLLVPADLETSLIWLMLSAEHGCAEAQYRLSGLTDEAADILDPAFDRVQWLCQAAERAHPQARYVLARLLVETGCVNPNAEVVFVLMTQAADAGVREAAAWMVRFYVDGQLPQESLQYLDLASDLVDGLSAYKLAMLLSEQQINTNQVFHCLQLAAAKGNNDAIFQLAFRTAQGGTEQDYCESARLYAIAAEAGITEAQFRYGLLLLSGLGCESNLTEAQVWLKRAADGGHTEAPFSLAQLHEILDESSEDVIELFSLIARGGSVGACIKLSEMSVNSEVVPADISLWTETLLQALNAGDPSVKQCLTFLFSRTPQQYANMDVAAHWYQAGAKLNDPGAQFGLAECYSLGLGGPRTLELAGNLYALSARGGNSNAQLQLGDDYYFGEGVKQDYEAAVVCYTLAASNGNSKAQFILASMYHHGDGVKGDKAQAVSLYRQAAKGGHALAQMALADMLMKIGSSESIQEAIGWYQQAAEAGLTEAMFLLGEFYAKGCTGVEPDRQRAMQSYEAAVALGHVSSQVALSRLLLESSVPGSVARAVKLLLSSQHGGSIEASYHLGVVNFHGLLGAPDQQAALKHYKVAALAGYAPAQLCLALMYLTGVAVNEDPNEASRWMELSAEQGLSQAQYLTGLIYAEGSGRAKDEHLSMQWFEKAAKQGHEDAERMLSKLNQERSQ